MIILKNSYLRQCKNILVINIRMKLKITQDKILIAIIIVIIAVLFNKNILEGFRQGRRFFWGYNPTSRNMTYDQRGDSDVRTVYKPKEVGVFANSGLYPNFQDIKK